MSGVRDYTEDLLKEMEENGVLPHDNLMNFSFDGEVHRFATIDKPHHQNGWYVIYPNSETGIPAGAYGDWGLSDDPFNWRAKESAERDFSQADLQHMRKQQEEAREKARKQKEKQAAAAAVEAQNIWENAQKSTEKHEYLQKKHIKPNTARIDNKGNLIVPLYDSNGQITSLRYISRDGKSKWFQKNGSVKGCYGILGDLKDQGRVYIAEGFSTAASIYEATGTATIISFGKGNILPVSVALKDKHPQLEQIIVADNDKSGVGEKAAQAAAAKTRARVILIPELGMDANDYAAAGKDLKALLLGATSKIEKAIIKPEDVEEAFRKTLDLSWIIKDIIPESSGLTMIYGPPGTYKSFIAIDMALCMANGISWHGKRIKQRNVLYIAAEGQAGILKRMEAWRQHKDIKKLKNIAILPMPARLDDGVELQDLKRAIRNLDPQPQFIFIDTLARSMDGEENSKTGMGAVVSAIDAIKIEFGIQVLVVHHSGKDASKGARGSNSLEGAVDTQFVVKKIASYEAVMDCERQKDDEQAEAIGFRLEKVDTGYKNVDGDAITSLVPVMDMEVKPKNSAEKKNSENMSTFERAWYASGAEDIDGFPYLTRSAWAKWLFENKISKNKNAADSAVRATGAGKAGKLIENGSIENYQSGYIVIDESWRFSMMEGKKM